MCIHFNSVKRYSSKTWSPKYDEYVYKIDIIVFCFCFVGVSLDNFLELNLKIDIIFLVGIFIMHHFGPSWWLLGVEICLRFCQFSFFSCFLSLSLVLLVLLRSCFGFFSCLFVHWSLWLLILSFSLLHPPFLIVEDVFEV